MLPILSGVVKYILTIIIGAVTGRLALRVLVVFQWPSHQEFFKWGAVKVAKSRLVDSSNLLFRDLVYRPRLFDEVSVAEPTPVHSSCLVRQYFAPSFFAENIGQNEGALWVTPFSARWNDVSMEPQHFISQISRRGREIVRGFCGVDMSLKTDDLGRRLSPIYELKRAKNELLFLVCRRGDD